MDLWRWAWRLFKSDSREETYAALLIVGVSGAWIWYQGQKGER